MKKLILLSMSVFLFAIFLIPTTHISSSNAQAEPALERAKFNGHDVVANEIIIKLKEGHANANSILKSYNLKSANKVLRRHRFKGKALEHANARGLHRIYLIKVGGGENFTRTLRALNQDDRIEYAEPNYIVEAITTPNDPDFSLLWGMNNTGQSGGTTDADIDAPEAWTTVTGSSTFVIGSIDTGVDYNHEDLAANMWSNPGEVLNGLDDDGNGFIDDIHGWNFIGAGSSDPMDDHGHGSHTAGTFGGVGNNLLGIAGVNWNVKIAALKFLSSGGSGTIADAVEALAYANMMGFKVTNNSWGGGGFSQAMADTLAAADAAGYLFVAAAGNSSSDNDAFPSYPSSYTNPNVIAVAATDHNDALSSFSSYGLTSVDVGAPGSTIFSTVPTGTCSLCISIGYRYLSGTSMASPHVAGAVALLWDHDPTLTHLEVKEKVMNLADPIPALDGKTVSGSRLNIYNFVDPDSAAPAAVNDLAAVDQTHSSVTLEFSAVGDDGLTGNATRYDMRYSTSSINAGNFDSAGQAFGEPVPSAPGTLESVTVAGLSQNTGYFFALKVLDNVGNGTLNSNLPVTATTLFATIIYSDDMESGTNGWTIDSPIATNLWHQSNRRASSPSTSWYYGQELTGNYETGAANQGSITSPIIDLAGVSGAELSFDHWMQTENLSPWDTGTVQVSDDGGSSWTSLAEYRSTSNVWVSESIDLSAYDESAIQVRFNFNTIDAIANIFEGWYVDDVEILGTTATPNSPPTADAGEDFNGTEDAMVFFDGSLSSDPDLDLLTYSWDFGDGNVGNGVTPAHTYTTGGTIFTATLVVNDGSQNSAPDVVEVTITEVNDDPVADAGPDQNGVAGVAISFDGSGSDDEEDGNNLAYSWDFGDGSPDAAGQMVNHTFATNGVYSVELTVTDSGSKMDSDSALANVALAPSNDTVTITKAEYNGSKSELKIEATSSMGGTADLFASVDGSPEVMMNYNRKKDVYKLTESGVFIKPTEVMVTSSEGGSDTAPVTEKGGGGGGGGGGPPGGCKGKKCN